MEARQRVTLEPAFLLHHYPYRDSSRIVELFTPEHGRIGAVARGVRSARSRLRGVLQPFSPLLVSWSGRGELVTLTDAERLGWQVAPAADALINAFYLNELILRLLRRNDPHPGLFDHYRLAIEGLLYSRANRERCLRLFECRLLAEIGYGLLLTAEADGGPAVETEGWYRYDVDRGPVRASGVQGDDVVPGRVLLGLAAGDLADDDLGYAKRLLRRVLSVYLGDRPLKSRAVMRSLAARSRKVAEDG